MRTNNKKSLIDKSTLKTLLKKELFQSGSNFKDKNFDKIGFVLKIIISLGFLLSFVFLFSKFSDIYLNVTIYGESDQTRRAFEMLTIIYQAILIILIISSIGQLNHALFHNQENMLYSAMPIDSNTLFVSKIFLVYIKQFVLSTIFIVIVNINLVRFVNGGFWNWFATLFMLFFLPSVSIVIASILLLPLRKIVDFFKGKFVLTFLMITAILALCFVAYYYVLELVKELLLGQEIKYFFDQNKMEAIEAMTKWLYPSNIFAAFVVGIEPVKNLVLCAVVGIICWLVSLLMQKMLFVKAMLAKTNGPRNFKCKPKKISKQKIIFLSLLKKEFLMIFRTTSYMFSYLSIAIVMPLMVYFCLSLGDSMVKSLVGVNTSFELAIFLTILFGALTNTFCATNISREGMMFYCIKAMPVSAKQMILSKVVLCLIVAIASNLINVIILGLTKYIGFGECIIVLIAGVAIAFSQICFATRMDLKYARFAQDENGEIAQSSELVSKIIIIGLVSAFVMGGVLLYLRVATDLRGANIDILVYILSIVVALVSASLFYYYLIRKLIQKYYAFEGGY